MLFYLQNGLNSQSIQWSKIFLRNDPYVATSYVTVKHKQPGRICSLLC